MDRKNTKMNNTKWQEQFDEKFMKEIEIGKWNPETNSLVKTKMMLGGSPDDIKQFISELLTRQRESFREAVEKKFADDHISGGVALEAHNQALREVLNIINPPKSSSEGKE
jgi:hypothetical protein